MASSSSRPAAYQRAVSQIVDQAEEMVEAARPVFDPNVWQYDEAADEFVNTKTGETRAEADFAWPDPFAEESGGANEWDAPQAAPDDADQSGGDWGSSQVRQGRRK